MRERKITFDAFPLLDLVHLEGCQQINEHGYLTFSGHISREQADACLNLALKPNLLVRATVSNDAEAERTFFEGVLVDFQIHVENQLSLLTATLKTGSYLTDLQPHIRSFQSAGISYASVLSTLSAGYQDGQFAVSTGGDQTIGAFTLQYLETDWAFAKRMASRLHTVLVPTGHFGQSGFSFGLPKPGACADIQTQTYSAFRDISRLHHNLGHGLAGQSEGDMLCFLYKTREIYQLGEQVRFNQQPLYIASILTHLEGAELYHTYRLASADGLRVPELQNDEVIGVSLTSSVTAVQKDCVQITIRQDENAAACGACWFPYATAYSSPDGTGWYCMPEVGDTVRLYVPTEQESGACVASSTHLQATGGARSNPDFKSIMNKQQKEVLFTPSSLLLTNNAGMSIELSDAEGITILSDKAIQIRSEAAVDITSATDVLKVTAPSTITLQQGSTQMKLQDHLFFKGAQVRME